jgi:hypothetical protein
MRAAGKKGEEGSTRTHDRIVDDSRGAGFEMVESRTRLNEEIAR